MTRSIFFIIIKISKQFRIREYIGFILIVIFNWRQRYCLWPL